MLNLRGYAAASEGGGVCSRGGHPPLLYTSFTMTRGVSYIAPLYGGIKSFVRPGGISYICSMENNNTPYSSRDAVIDLYMHNDLPEDELAFQYIVPGGRTAWIHKDELRREAALRTSYPQANTQKGKK